MRTYLHSCYTDAKRKPYPSFRMVPFPTRNTSCRTRSLSNATFFHFWSRDVHPVQNLLLCTKFHKNLMIFHWDMAIYRFSKWRPFAILGLFTTIRDHPRSLCCWPQLPVKFHINLIHRSEDSCLNFSYIWLEITIQAPKWRFWGTLGPLMW